MSGEEFGFGQSPPISTELPSAHDLVIADMKKELLAQGWKPYSAPNDNRYLARYWFEVLEFSATIIFYKDGDNKCELDHVYSTHHIRECYEERRQAGATLVEKLDEAKVIAAKLGVELNW